MVWHNNSFLIILEEENTNPYGLNCCHSFFVKGVIFVLLTPICALLINSGTLNISYMVYANKFSVSKNATCFLDAGKPPNEA